MTDNEPKLDGQLAIASLLAIFFIFLTAWLVYISQVKIPQEHANAERLVQASESEESTSDASAVAETRPEVDMAVVETAVGQGGCAACHTIPGIDGAIGQVGPDLTNIGVEGFSRIPDYSAEEYIRESIVAPLAFTAPKCPTGDCIAGAMPPVQLEGDALDVLVTYLSTLGVQYAD